MTEGGGLEHLRHTRAAPRAAVADHYHVASLDFPAEDGGIGQVFGVVAAGRPFEAGAFLPGDLGYGAVLGQVAAQDADVPVGFDGGRIQGG